MISFASITLTLCNLGASPESRPSPTSRDRIPATESVTTSAPSISLHPPVLIPTLISLVGCSRPHECQARNGRKSFGRGNHFLTTMSHLSSSHLSEGTVCRPRPYHPRTNLPLSKKKKPANFKPYSYWQLVSLCYPIAQHICAIFIFLATFLRIKERMLDPRLLVWASIFLFVLGYIVWQAIETQLAKQFHQLRRPANRESFFPSPSPDTESFSADAKTVKSSILAFLALLSLSPVMKTLTASTSSDSIWALAACLFVLNALIADYSSPRPVFHARERCAL